LETSLMKTHNETGEPPAPRPAEPEPGNIPAWEMIEPGRYRPRRIRGSYRGRELG
jgi:hypothetical protein